MDQVLAIWASVTPLIEFIKLLLLKVDFFAQLEEKTQSIVLLVIAYALSLVSCVRLGVNAFPELDAVGFFFTSLICVLGESGIHLVFAWIGVRANVTASAPSRAQAVAAGSRTYAPFM